MMAPLGDELCRLNANEPPEFPTDQSLGYAILRRVSQRGSARKRDHDDLFGQERHGAQPSAELQASAI